MSELRNDPRPVRGQQVGETGSISAISADLFDPPPRAMRGLMASLLALIAAFVIWTAFAALEEVTRGVGRVVPASKIQVVQNLEGGIVEEILVREGAMVRKGQVLLRIDPTLIDATLGETQEKIFGLKILIARLGAEIDGKPLEFAEDLERERPNLVDVQRDHYQTRQRELGGSISVLDLQEKQRKQEILEAEARIETLSRASAIADNELKLVQDLAVDQAASRAELLQAQAKLNDIQGNLTATQLALPRLRAAHDEIANRKAERIQAFRSDALQKMAAARVELNGLEETRRGGRNRMERTTVRAPAAGIIKTLNVSTTGQVIQPGHNLIEIVPLNDTLLIEAQVRPQDIAFLRPGQEALVKITAYDFSLYGGLSGRLEHIGADSIATDKGESYYIIRVRTEKSHLTHGSERLPIIPGMVAEVDVKTGTKTVLGYLTKPLVRVRQMALTER